MNRKHAVTISLAAGLAALAGTVAATKTVQLGHSAGAKPTTASALIAARTKALDRTEIALHKALGRKPPKLPSLPASTPVATAGLASTLVSASAVQQGPQRVVYVRPAPHVVTVHRSGGGEYEAEGDSHEGGGEGGFDD